MQRGVLHDDAAHLDRLEHRKRMQIAKLADAPLNLPQLCDLRCRRELPGNRPARVAADHAQPPLLLGVIDLDHDAIDLEAERATPLLPLQAALDRLLLASEPFNVAVDREAALAQPLQRLPLRAEADPFAGAYAVGPEREWPLGGEARVELTQRPCCRIARVHEGRLAVAGTALVEALEALQ